MKKLKKVCIANRGEIALRIGRACKALGIETFQPLSEADAGNSFRLAADSYEVIGGAAAAESYLNIERLVAAAAAAGCDAVHPGYGFLAENANFARAVQEAGLVFVGPAPEIIDLLGNKTEARKSVVARGVSVAPGVEAGLSDAALLEAADTIGFPLILKAVGGGGGRGMRVVRTASEMRDALPRVRSEARKFFASEDVYFERFIEKPRHVEVQLMGDSAGTVLHFGTRECSMQRRHQKILEEAPARFIDATLEARILQDAVEAARAVGYTNAGTAEFLVSGSQHYFLEINTRIQVEHPATELVTGVDLVQLQLQIAAGNELTLRQDNIVCTGHAIECRVYAEDAAHNFAPARGTISAIRAPTYDFFREDRGYEAGDIVSLHYDALLTKLLVKADTRAEAIARMRQVLFAYSVAGVETSLPFHRWLFLQSAFVSDNFDTGFLDACFSAEQLALAEKIWCEAGLKSHFDDNSAQQ